MRATVKLKTVLLWLLMPVMFMFAADLLFLSRGLDAFHRFENAEGVVRSISDEVIEIRKSSGGTSLNPSMHETRTRPLVEYEFEYLGKTYTSSRYFLVQPNALSDLPSTKDRPTSVTSRVLRKVQVGSQLDVRVAKSNPLISYLDFGWSGVYLVCRYWSFIYVVFGGFYSIGHLLLVISKASRGK